MAELELEINRLANRLGALGPARVCGEPAQSVRELIQYLADAEAEISGEPHRTVPRLADHALGDQVTVIGRELAHILATAEHSSTRLDALIREVTSVRRSLP